MREIKLSQWGENRGKYVALVDDEDFEILDQYKWHVYKHRNTFYAIRSTRVNGKQTTVCMHSVIMGGKGIDHRDHNGLNNQRTNLRFCTNSENQMNKSKQIGISSIYKGVHFDKGHKKWRAAIRINNKIIHLGYFTSEIDAAKAYNTKAVSLFCEFANLNDVN